MAIEARNNNNQISKWDERSESPIPQEIKKIQFPSLMEKVPEGRMRLRGVWGVSFVNLNLFQVLFTNKLQYCIRITNAEEWGDYFARIANPRQRGGQVCLCEKSGCHAGDNDSLTCLVIQTRTAKA